MLSQWIFCGNEYNVTGSENRKVDRDRLTCPASAACRRRSERTNTPLLEKREIPIDKA